MDRAISAPDLSKQLLVQPGHETFEKSQTDKIELVAWKTERNQVFVRKFVQVADGRFLTGACPLRLSSWLTLASVFAVFFSSLGCAPAYGDVGVVLNESLDTSMARITGAGHSAVYFSRICPETPVKLRLCRADEPGSVMSNYTTLGEDEPFEWNIVPLYVYLYGVEDPQNRPLFGSWKIKRALEERYRERSLAEYCAKRFCRTSNNAEWREMVAATIERSIYIFAVSTTVEQDLQLIAEFNSAPNVNHFNGITRNCATFTRHIINTYFPNAAKADYFNDFGMTTPKAIARSFAHYGERHPESNFHVLHFAQLPGTVKRSTECRTGTEQLYRSKKLLVPMLIFADYGVPAVAASYILTARFSPERELENYPSPDATAVVQEFRKAKAAKDTERAEELQALQSQEREQVVGTAQEWKDYRNSWETLAREAVREEIIPDREYLDRFFKHLEKDGTPVADSSGALWIDVSENGKTTRLGVSASNVLAPASDSRLAYTLALARTECVFKSPKHGRENMMEFRGNWSMLEASRVRNESANISSPSTSPAVGSSLAPFGNQ